MRKIYVLSAIAACCMLDTTSYAQQVYACTANGRKAYQQMPCKEDGQTVEQDMLQREQARQQTLERERRAAETERKRQERIETAPDHLLSPADLAERNRRRVDAAAKEHQRKIEDGTYERERQAALNKYCGGKYLDLRLGMTEEQVRRCTEFQTPDTVNTTTTVQGARKQYVYRSFQTYLYFENGVLVTIQR